MKTQSTDVIQLTLTLKMTTAQVVETSVTVNNHSPIQDYVHPDDQTQPTFEILYLTCSAESWFFFLIWQHYLDPPKDLKEALKSKGIPDSCFFTLKHGETKVIK